MNRIRNGLMTLTFLLVTFHLFSMAQTSKKSRPEPIPMQKGTRWLYRGEVGWQEGAGERKRAVDWKMEVLDHAERGRYSVSLISGHPSGLAWYEEGRKPGCNLLIAVDHSKYYLRDCSPLVSRDKLNLPDGNLDRWVDVDHLVLQWPLREGDIFGGDPDRHGMYAWSVDAVNALNIKDVRGISPLVQRTEYVLIFRTNPDHVISTYVPGIGLTAYTYSHHGTVAEVSVKLVDFQVPARK